METTGSNYIFQAHGSYPAFSAQLVKCLLQTVMCFASNKNAKDNNLKAPPFLLQKLSPDIQGRQLDRLPVDKTIVNFL